MRLRVRGHRRSARLSLLALLGLLFAAGCSPGIEIELVNESDRDIGITRVIGPSDVRREVLAAHDTLTLGQAHVWYVHLGNDRIELQHPGPEFAGRSWTSSEIYRFRVSEEGCIYVLSPDEGKGDASAVDALSQPPGYPLGPLDTCSRR